MLRTIRGRWPVAREVIWFASGRYSAALYPAPITYFRQHRLSIPARYVVTSERFDTLFLDLSRDVEKLRRGLTKTVRYEVSRASSLPIDVSVAGQDSESIAAFCERLRQFNMRKGLGSPLTYSDLEPVKDQWRLYSASHQGVWLADLLLVWDEERARQWAAPNNLDYTPRAVVGYASKSLVWRSICDAKEAGLPLYDFGGIVRDPSDRGSGITQYKRAFGGDEAQETNSLVIPNPLYRLAYRAFLALRALPGWARSGGPRDE